MVNETFDGVITSAKAAAAKYNTTIEGVLSQWEVADERLKGLQAYYESTQTPANGSPPPPTVIPAPAIPQDPSTPLIGQLSDYAQSQLMTIATSYSEPMERLTQIYWEMSNDIKAANPTITEQNLADQSILFTQCKIQDEKSGNNAAFEFIPLRVIRAYQRDKMETIEHPPGSGNKVKVETKKWTAAAHGIFRKQDENGVVDSRLGTLAIWDGEEEAKAVGGLQTYTSYRAELDFKNHTYYWNTQLNAPTVFQKIADLPPAEVNLEAQQLAGKTGKVVTPQSLNTMHIESDNTILIVEGRIGKVWSGTTKKGKPSGSLKLLEASHNTDTTINPTFVNYYSQITDIYKFGQSSHVLIVCNVNPPSQAGKSPFVIGQFQIPVMVVPGRPPNQPSLPQAFNPPVGQ